MADNRAGKYNVRLDEHAQKRGKAQEVLKKLFAGKEEGEALQLVASSIGAPQDSQVTILRGGKSVQRRGAPFIHVAIEHPQIEACLRTLYVLEHDESRVVYNAELETKDKELVLKMLHDEVQGAAQNGFAAIETDATGSFQSDEQGYYFWPLLGFDKKLEDMEGFELLLSGLAEDGDFSELALVQKIYERFGEADTIQEVLSAPEAKIEEKEAQEIRQLLETRDKKLNLPVRERPVISGREWWLVKGSTLTNTRFDLSPDSSAQKILSAYLARRGKKSGQPQS